MSDRVARPVREATANLCLAGEFHAFPDSMAKQIGAACQDFAANVVDGTRRRLKPWDDQRKIANAKVFSSLN